MLWVKSFHIIFMVTWFAGLFYLPRLFVYHASANDRASIDRFKIMERKLFWGIATPGGIITIALGFWLIEMIGFSYSALWLQAKLVLVGVLVVYHVWCGKLVADFKQDSNRHSHVWYRFFNEFPVLILIGVVLLVEFKPV
ncbi:MAG: protoporphyrinogen oxidase HemJ [Gammaproteobacteria bacterium]|nr:protoporphyrinogen oxidase HemJ [Gammaproteobacteria bacterium]NNL07526.1 protoporphyrinogen oxidase HemJ [Gammaproteobacteria bacterium]